MANKEIIAVEKEYRDLLICDCFSENPTEEDEKRMSVVAYGKKLEKDSVEPEKYKESTDDIEKCLNCNKHKKFYKRLLVTTIEEEVKV